MVQNTVAGFYRRQLTPQPRVEWGTPPPDPNIYTTIHSILVALVILDGMIVLSSLRKAAGFVYWGEARW